MSIKHRIWLTEEQKLIAIQRYEKGETPVEIGKSFGVCANNIRNALRNYGVEIRDRSTARTKISHWKEAFDVITPESAYWIGFLFADGTVYKPKVGAHIISVGLAERDRGHLDKLRTFLKSEHVLSVTKNTIRGKTHPGIRFTIRSQNLALALFANGMRVKSLERIATPVLVGIRDFWRGVVDGDGWISISNNKIRVGLCGGFELIKQFVDFLSSHKIGKDVPIRAQGKIFRVDLSCSTAVSVLRLLYDHNTIALDRKFILVQELLAAYVTEASPI